MDDDKPKPGVLAQERARRRQHEIDGTIDPARAEATQRINALHGVVLPADRDNGKDDDS